MRDFRYETEKRVDGLVKGLAWRLPRRLVMWAYVRVAANATTGRYSDTVMPELSVVDALKRWD